MKAKITCSVINDLLPLYVDNVVSHDSKTLVEEHLDECKFCRAAVAQMENTLVIEKNTDKEHISTMKKNVENKNFLRITFFCLAAIILLMTSGIVLGYIINEKSGDQISNICIFWSIVIPIIISIAVIIGWVMYFIYYKGRANENISAVVKKKATIAYSCLLIACAIFLLGFKTMFLGSAALSENVRVRTEFQYSEDSYLNQEWVIHFFLENNKAINVISQSVYTEYENGERMKTGEILYVNEVPIKGMMETSSYTCGYSVGEPYGIYVEPTIANYTITVVYKDKTQIYDMRKEGLFRKQDNVRHFPETSDNAVPDMTVRTANGHTAVYKE